MPSLLTTRSGTNEVHGSAFETMRNSGLGVARARQDFYTKPPHLVRNEFGASLGGPVFLPKLYNGRNRTFFFFAYEGYQLRSASTRSIAVPPEAFRQGASAPGLSVRVRANGVESEGGHAASARTGRVDPLPARVATSMSSMSSK